MAFTLGGDLATFDAATFRSKLSTKFPTAYAVTLDVAAGSVVASASLQYLDASGANAAAATITSTNSTNIQSDWLQGLYSVQAVSAPVVTTKMITAPSPPPPSPPPPSPPPTPPPPAFPPFPPPLVTAAQAAFSETIKAVTGAVTTAVATSIAASTAASVGASTAASAASSSVSSATSVKPGGAVPALLGAQRFGMYGSASGQQAPEDQACTAYEPNLLMGRIGLFGAVSGQTTAAEDTSPNGTCAAASSEGEGEAVADGPGRRLQGRRRGKGGGTAGNTAITTYLIFVLADNVSMYFMTIVAVMTCHVLLSNCYRCVLNRNYYRKLRRERLRLGRELTEDDKVDLDLPKFRPLPPALVFPRFEIMISTIFITGLMESAANILGTFAGEYELAASLIGVSAAVVILVFSFLITQGIKVRRFYREHMQTVWSPSPRIRSHREMDDPVLRLIYSCCCLKPVLRFRGEYKPPELATAEPGRTERALKRSEWFGLRHVFAKTCGCGRGTEGGRGAKAVSGLVDVVLAEEDSKTTSRTAVGESERSSISGGITTTRTARQKARMAAAIKPVAVKPKGRREKFAMNRAATTLQAIHRGNTGRSFVEDLRIACAEEDETPAQTMKRLREEYGMDRPPAIDEAEAFEAAAQYEELSVWLEHGSGGSEVGALWTIGQTGGQLILAFAISMYSVLGREYEWAKRTSLTIMCTVQLLMAAWGIGADAIDRLEAVVACMVSLLEACATGLLLASSFLQGMLSEDVLEAVGQTSTALLMASVFAPIVLSTYDNMILPAADAMSARMKSGQSCGRAACGLLIQMLLLPITVAGALFGVSFKASDVIQAAIDETRDTVTDGKAVAQETRRRGRKRDKRTLPVKPADVEALHDWGQDGGGSIGDSVTQPSCGSLPSGKDLPPPMPPTHDLPPPLAGEPVTPLTGTGRNADGDEESLWSSPAQWWAFLSPQRAEDSPPLAPNSAPSSASAALYA